MPVTDQWPSFSKRGRGSVWIFVAMLVGLVLAVVLMPRPDTGPELAPSTTSSAADNVEAPDNAEQPATDPVAPGQRALSPEGIVKPQIRPPSRGGDPMQKRKERTKRLKDPIPVAVGRIMGPWTQVRRLLNTHTEDPFSMELAERTQNLLLALREFRRSGTDSNWEPIHAQQRELLDLLKQTPANNEEMQKMTARIAEVLDTIPAKP